MKYAHIICKMSTQDHLGTANSTTENLLMFRFFRYLVQPCTSFSEVNSEIHIHMIFIA